MFDDVVNVFVAASGTGGEDGAVGMFFSPFDGIGDGVGTFESGDNAFVTGEHEESLNGFFVAGGDVVDASEVMPEGVFGTDSLIVKTAGDGVNGSGFALFVSKNIGIKTVEYVVFLPPTLISSMYGMNFDWMPELHWKLGYPFAIGLMLVFTLAILLIFKWKKWL